MSAALDDVDLHARRWLAEDRIIYHARSLSADLALDPSHVERMESAALYGDSDAFELALGELLGEIAAR